jgi:DNA-binding MarR family transcriptional regulator
MHDTHDIDRLVAALIDLTGFLSSPQRDDALLRAAGVRLDRALFPLLVRLAAEGGLSVGRLADQVGRDHTTVSRQLAKLEGLGLVRRQGPGPDRRVNAAALTAEGEQVAGAIAQARRRLLSEALAAWSPADRASLADLNRRFVDALVAAAEPRPTPRG